MISKKKKRKSFKFEKYLPVPRIRSALRICGSGGKLTRLGINSRQYAGLLFIRVKTNLKSTKPAEN